jgi:hypothetical protein
MPMKRFIEGENRFQSTLFPECLMEDVIDKAAATLKRERDAMRQMRH